LDVQDIRLARARWLLGLLHPEPLVEFACDALEADVDSPSLRILAGEIQPTRETLEPLFRRVLEELGCEPLDELQARGLVAQSWATQIVAGAVTPYDGAKAIWRECCDVMGPRTRLDAFLSLASEHEDFRFAQLSTPAAYASEIRQCEQQIVQEARDLLRDSAA